MLFGTNICYCINKECKNKKCERHWRNAEELIKKFGGYVTCADFTNSEICPKKNGD